MKVDKKSFSNLKVAGCALVAYAILSSITKKSSVQFYQFFDFAAILIGSISVYFFWDFKNQLEKVFCLVNIISSVVVFVGLLKSFNANLGYKYSGYQWGVIHGVLLLNWFLTFNYLNNTS